MQLERQIQPKNVTGTEDIGAPRPDTEGLVERNPSALLSYNRGSAQVDAQVCPAKGATGTSKKTSKAIVVTSTEDGIESEEDYQIP